MIVYKDILQKLKDSGYSTYRLQKDKLIAQGTIEKIRYGQPVTIRTIDTICRLAGCQPGDILAYVPDAVED